MGYPKLSIHVRDDYVCQYCAIDLEIHEATIDHVTPKCLGGGDQPANLVTACQPCNTRKDGRTPKGAAMPLLRDMGFLR